MIDTAPRSPHYGAIVASLPTGQAGTHPHHAEQEVPPDGHLLANGFMTGSSFLFDVSDPLHPRLATSFGDVGGLSHPHTYSRLANGDVLATFQYAAEAMTADGHGARFDVARWPTHDGRSRRDGRAWTFDSEWGHRGVGSSLAIG